MAAGLLVGLEDRLVDVEVDQQTGVRHPRRRALVYEVIAGHGELGLAQVEQRPEKSARVVAAALLVGAPHESAELADVARAAAVGGHAVGHVQRDEGHPRLEVQLAELYAD